MKNALLFFIGFSLCFNIHSQNASNYWFFGQNAGIIFDNGVPNIQNNSSINTWEGTSSVAIKDSLFFYSDGTSIYNKNNNKIPNIVLNGNKSSTQGVILFKHIDNDSVIFIITTTLLDYGECPLYFYKLKLLNDTTLSLISSRLINQFASEKTNLIYHQNQRDFLLITHSYNYNSYYIYSINKNGINDCPVINNIGANYQTLRFPNAGQIKFSPKRNFICASTLALHQVDLFKLNSTNGILYDSIKIDVTRNYGIEFSSDETFVYISDLQGNLYQYSLKNWNKDSILNSEKLITNKGVKKISALQLAPNGKIYWSMNDSLYLSAIEEPNKRGDSCKLNFRSLYLNGKKCAYGLPTFNQSEFYTPAINYSYEMNCIKNSIQFWGKDTFGANSHVWQVRKLAVGNWQLVGSTKNINYTFADTGTYEVRYIASNGSKADTVVKSIVLYDKIKQGFLGKDTTYVQGDVINKTLFAPVPNHCVRWWFSKDLTPALSKGEGANLVVDSVGTYICKVTNQAFCEVWDTIVISECINNLNQPSLFRSRDTLRTFHLNADSFVWFRNNQIYKVTKQPFLALTDTGTYRVEAAKKGHCNRGSVGQLMVNRLSVNGINIEDLGIRVFPNPSEGKISIHSQNPFKLKINTLLGQTIYEAENIDNIHLPKGIFFLHFEVGGIRGVEKVVIW
ncbi:MAG: hypothetical protein Q8K70_12915 [Bacteroidota bacterium]|nr:hypothetical protein [Bacteroidota bacterium]